MQIRKFAVDGMTCRSCELLIEKRLKVLPGVRQADVNAEKGVARVICEGEPPTLEAIDGAIKGDGYHAYPPGTVPKGTVPVDNSRPSFGQLAGLFALVLVLGWVASKMGLLKTGFAADAATGFWAVFVVGLVAASSACLAVTGGLLLSIAAKHRERLGAHASAAARMSPVALFVAGRVASYGLLGGFIGLVGKALAPGPTTTGAITILAALYMLVAGLDMLHLTPAWLKGLLPKMPKGIARRVMDADGSPRPAAPFLMGAGTFFIPCGFTQSLQIYALSTGSFARSALLLTAFALGTAPALLALGWASGAFKGSAGRFFMRFSGALVVVLGLWNAQNGLTAMGYAIRLPDFPPAASAGTEATARDPNVAVENGVQIIRMRLSVDPFYLPSDTYTVRAGMPVRMEVSGVGTGCRSGFQIPRLGVRGPLNKPLNVFEFTPKKQGQYVFSCSMGMFPGALNVISQS